MLGLGHVSPGNWRRCQPLWGSHIPWQLHCPWPSHLDFMGLHQPRQL